MNKSPRLLSFFAILLLISCKTQNTDSQLNYLQNIEKMATDISTRNTDPTIQVGDKLSIYVTAKDMTVVLPFNQNYSLMDAVQYSTASNNTPNANVTERSSSPTYIVDTEGGIDFPVLGRLETRGKTLLQFKNEIRDRVTDFVKAPVVNMKIVNHRVVVLGEVTKPGEYLLPEGQSTVLSAIGLAGDLTMYGKRNDILVVRNIDGEISKQRIDLADPNFMNSPFYELRQNDVIYVSSNETKEKVARLDPKTNIYIAVAGTIIGLAGIFVTIFKK